MASKKPKGELVAICKLEFYRKQKHWRYGPQERKGKDSKKRPKTTNAKLNQTYNIAQAPEKQDPPIPEVQETEERHILDEAFVDTETGTESDELVQREDQDQTGADKTSSLPDPPGIPYSPKWSIQRWAERRRLWDPEPTPTSDPACPTRDPTCPTVAATCPALDPLPQQTIPRENANCPIFDNNYNKIQQDIYHSKNYLKLHCKGSEYDANIPTQCYDTKPAQEPLEPQYGVSMVYYNSKMFHHELDVPQSGVDVDAGAGREWEGCAGEGALWTDPDWLEEVAAVGAGGEDAVDGDWHLHDLSEVSQCDSLPSAASSEFVRGAALAPHSTQIDLLLGPEPARLPAPALAAAVARHSAALRALLDEAQRRQQMSMDAAHPLPDLYSFDEIPVRDPGSFPPPFNDPILASSRPSRPAPAPSPHGGPEGRGRGRPKVAIRMGRPYRL